MSKHTLRSIVQSVIREGIQREEGLLLDRRASPQDIERLVVRCVADDAFWAHAEDDLAILATGEYGDLSEEEVERMYPNWSQDDFDEALKQARRKRSARDIQRSGSRRLSSGWQTSPGFRAKRIEATPVREKDVWKSVENKSGDAVIAIIKPPYSGTGLYSPSLVWRTMEVPEDSLDKYKWKRFSPQPDEASAEARINRALYEDPDVNAENVASIDPMHFFGIERHTTYEAFPRTRKHTRDTARLMHMGVSSEDIEALARFYTPEEIMDLIKKGMSLEDIKDLLDV